MSPDHPISTGPTERAEPAHAPTARAGISAAAAVLTRGDVAGDYRIVRRVGGGAMGDVYEGEAAAIGKRVAIKVLKNLAAASDEAAERFLREARAVNKINHRNVLDVFAFGKLADGRLYLVMDLLTGESLGDRLRRAGALSPSDFLAIATPIARALDAAHRAGIVHRDLKPDNVFLAEHADGMHVYVLDFGIAKMLADAASGEANVTLTGEGTWIGTPAYMSPEQWAADPASPQSDVYALGCTAFEMLTGEVPYRADSVPGIMQKHFNEAPPPLRNIGGTDDIPPSFADAIEHALAKEPEQRPQGALAFLDELNGDVSPRRQSARGVRFLAAALALAVAALAVLVVLSKRGQQEPEPRPSTALSSRWDLTIDALPVVATISVRGHERSTGRLELRDLEQHDVVTAEVSAPGCTSRETTFTHRDEGNHEIKLSPVRAFEGLWQLADDSLRLLERDGDGVLVFHLENQDAEPQFLRRFAFQAASGNWVQFAGTVSMVDSRAPKSPSCQFELTSVYRFHPGRGALQLQRETVAVRFETRSGQCAISDRHKLGWEDVTRVKRAASDVVWAVSRGGARKFITAPSRLTFSSETEVLKDRARRAQPRKGNRSKGRQGKQKKAVSDIAGANPSRSKNAPKSAAKTAAKKSPKTASKTAPKKSPKKAKKSRSSPQKR